MDEAKHIVNNLTQAIQKLWNKQVQQPGRHAKTLKTLATIFYNITNNIQQNTEKMIQTSTNPTAPKNIQ